MLSRVAPDLRADLEQARADRRGAAVGQFRTLQRHRPQARHQRVRQRRDHQAHLVGVESMAAGPRAEQVELRFFDAVLRLAAGAVDLVVELLARLLEVGHHEPWVDPLVAVLQTCDHTALAIPRLGCVAELTDLALFDTAAPVRLGHRHFDHCHGVFEPAIACQPDHVAHARTLAPANQPLAAKSRIATHHDLHRGPAAPDPIDQQSHYRPSMLGPVDLAVSQVAHQHRLAAEHVQRQVAVMVVVGVEFAALLIAVQGYVRGVDVEHDALGRVFMRRDKLVHQHPVQRHRLPARRAILEPAQCRRGRHRVLHPDRRLHQHVLAQRRVIVQVLVAAAHGVDALRQQIAKLVGDQQRVARIADRLRRGARQTQPLIGLAQQHHAPIAAQPTAVEIGLDHPSPDPPKNYLGLGTIWHRRISSGCVGRNGVSTCFNARIHECADLFLAGPTKFPG